MDRNRLAWASRITDDLPAQAVSAHRTLSMLMSDNTDGIDIEAKVCRLIGFDPVTYTLVEELAADSVKEIPKEWQLSLIIS